MGSASLFDNLDVAGLAHAASVEFAAYVDALCGQLLVAHPVVAPLAHALRVVLLGGVLAHCHLFLALHVAPFLDRERLAR